MIASAPLYTFNAERHEYAIDGVRVPSITQLLKQGGLVDDRYYTEESRRRGQAIHSMASDFDLGVDLGDELKVSPYRGYVMAYMAAVAALQPTWEQIEVFDVHPRYRFGGRPDRVGECFGRLTVAEIKSAAKAAHHTVQTGLQGLLVAERKQVEPLSIQRLVIYLKPTGKYSIEECTQRSDFDSAHDLIRRFC